jgi:hypothetical protein
MRKKNEFASQMSFEDSYLLVLYRESGKLCVLGLVLYSLLSSRMQRNLPKDKSVLLKCQIFYTGLTHLYDHPFLPFSVIFA